LLIARPSSVPDPAAGSAPEGASRRSSAEAPVPTASRRPFARLRFTTELRVLLEAVGALVAVEFLLLVLTGGRAGLARSAVVTAATAFLCAPFFYVCIVRGRYRQLVAETRLRRDFQMQSFLRAIEEACREDEPLTVTFERVLGVFLSSPCVPLLPKAAVLVARPDRRGFEVAARQGLDLSTESCWEDGARSCPLGAGACPCVRPVAELPRESFLASPGRCCIPVVGGKKTLGLLALRVPEGHAWSEEERFSLRSAADLLGRHLARREAFSELERVERRDRRIVEASPEAILLAGADGTIIDVNPGAVRLFGGSREALWGRTLSELVDEKDGPELRRFLHDVLAGTGGPRRSHWRLGPAGGRRHVEAFGAVLLEEGGPRVVVYALDVGERCDAEEECRRFAAAVEQAAEAVVVADAAGVVRHVNPAYTEVTGYPAAEVVGVGAEVLRGRDVDMGFFRTLRNAVKAGASSKGRIISRRREGTFYEEEATIHPVRGASGEIVSYVGVRRDVTTQARLEERLRQAEKMEGVGMLAGGVAHDFNNLLTLIMGYNALIADGLDSKSPLNAFTRSIRKAAEGAAAMTKQLLAFSRRQVIAPRVLDLNAVVTDASRMLRRLVRENITFIEDLQPGLWSIRADPGQVDQVILNLVVNARDAMPKGGKLTIGTANETLPAGTRPDPRTGLNPGDYVVLTVSDTGTGMDAAVRERIFEPFFTTKELGKGTGLGLATVYGIVKQNAGSVTVRSEPGRGSSFEIRLPRVEGEPVSQRARPPGRSHGGHETLLVVEDSPELRRLIERTLRESGYKVLHAESAEEALALSKDYSGEVHLLLTDIVLPGMGGMELVRTLSDLRPEMKVLCMSGYAWASGHEALPYNAVLLHKPFDGDTLLRNIRQTLG
jgi:PAS domain S-box-containing protein